MKPSLSSSEVRALLHERLDALLSDCDKVMDSAAYGRTPSSAVLPVKQAKNFPPRLLTVWCSVKLFRRQKRFSRVLCRWHLRSHS